MSLNSLGQQGVEIRDPLPLSASSRHSVQFKSSRKQAVALGKGRPTENGWSSLRPATHGAAGPLAQSTKKKPLEHNLASILSVHHAFIQDNESCVMQGTQICRKILHFENSGKKPF